MNDWAKIVTVLLLAATAFVAAYFIVAFLHPLFAVIAWFVMTVFLVNAVMYFAPVIRTPLSLVIVAAAAAIASAVAVWLLYDLVKVLAVIVLGWYIFRVLLRSVAKEIEDEIRAVFE